jgi:hypothetical protein
MYGTRALRRCIVALIIVSHDGEGAGRSYLDHDHTRWSQ